MDFFKTLDLRFRKWALEIANFIQVNFKGQVKPRFIAYFAIVDFAVMMLAFTQYRVFEYVLLWLAFCGAQYVERALAIVQKTKNYKPLIPRNILVYVVSLSGLWTLIILFRKIS
jgi:hypothetical protein